MTIKQNKRNSNLRNMTLKIPKEMFNVLKLVAEQEKTTPEQVSIFILDNILRGMLSRALEANEAAQNKTETTEEVKTEE